MIPNPACSFTLIKDQKYEAWVFKTLWEAKKVLNSLLEHSPEISREVKKVDNFLIKEIITCQDETKIILPIIKNLTFKDIENTSDKKDQKLHYSISKKIQQLKSLQIEKIPDETLMDLQDIIQDLGITGKRARRLLKRAKIQKPGKTWSWPLGKPVEDIKKCLIDLIEKYKKENDDETDALSNS